jgi:hypothetical protein
MPAARAAAEPPLEPPGVRSGFQGFRVMPVRGESVTPFQPNSGVVVLPRIMAPCSRTLATAGASSAHRWFGSTSFERRPPFCEDRILDSNRHAIELAKAGLAVPSRLRLPCLNKNLLSIGRTHEDVQIYTPLCAIEACLCDFDRGQRSLLVHLGNLSRAQIRNFSCHPYLAYEQCASVKLTSFSLSRQRAPLPLVGRSWGWMYLRDPVQTTTTTLAAPHKAPQGGGSRPSLLLSVSIALRAVFTLRRETVPARALSQAAR